MLHFTSRPAHEVRAIQRITDADDLRQQAKADRRNQDVVAAERYLQTAVNAASDGGISWQTIGEALGMRRGAAYQRFRRRPNSPRMTSSRVA